MRIDPSMVTGYGLLVRGPTHSDWAVAIELILQGCIARNYASDKTFPDLAPDAGVGRRGMTDGFCRIQFNRHF